jgi:hypothetical protein
MFWKPADPTRNEGFTVNLEGGIGNQLFQYVAGMSLALYKSCTLTVNTSRVQGNRHGGECITSFVMPNICQVEDVMNRPKLDNRVSRVIRFKISPQVTNFKAYFSPEVGFDENLMKLAKGTKINGYFQTFRYLYFLRSNGIVFQDLELKTASSLFTSLSSQAYLSLPVVLHFRRGDYYAFSQEFGLLSSNYYSQAIEQLSLTSQIKEVWIYSDDFEIAKRELAHLKNDVSLRFMDETETMSAPEVLKLMAIGSAHVIANSSFSWWSASLSKTSSRVIAPNPWFKERVSPKELIPGNWLIQKSLWV